MTYFSSYDSFIFDIKFYNTFLMKIYLNQRYNNFLTIVTSLFYSVHNMTHSQHIYVARGDNELGLFAKSSGSTRSKTRLVVAWLGFILGSKT